MARWAENPYWQHFCGETFFQHRQPIDPSSLTRWRNRIGEEGVEWLLTETIEAGKRSGAVKGSDLKRVTVDTTVMEKNIAHPTGARLFEAARRTGATSSALFRALVSNPRRAAALLREHLPDDMAALIDFQHPP